MPEGGVKQAGTRPLDKGVKLARQVVYFDLHGVLFHQEQCTGTAPAIKPNRTPVTRDEGARHSRGPAAKGAAEVCCCQPAWHNEKMAPWTRICFIW
jgi:hypothetical protein